MRPTSEARLKTISPLTLILLCVSSVSAQRSFPAPPKYPPQLSSELQQIRQAALASGYAWTELAYLTNNIGPRPAGSVQANFAAQYVAAELLKLGLEVHL